MHDGAQCSQLYENIPIEFNLINVPDELVSF